MKNQSSHLVTLIKSTSLNKLPIDADRYRCFTHTHKLLLSVFYNNSML